MFKSKTLFIVGAGASQEFGFPVGDELKGIIAKKLDFEFDGLRGISSGDDYIRNSFINKLISNTRYTHDDLENDVYACRAIRDAMPLAKSIDSFIESHKDNEYIQSCAKLGIAASILEAEEVSKLYIDRRPSKPKMDFNIIKDTWIVPFFKVLKEGCTVEELKESIDNVYFIVFNYDRSIEHFIRHAIATYFNISFNDACDIANNLNIIHPYGVVGQLPDKNTPQHVNFGEVSVKNIIAAANQIKTFSENISNHSSLEKMKNFVEEAETIVFLGFGFHDQNVNMVFQGKANAIRVFATTYKLSDYNSEH
jgi:hypothetical protein